MKTSTYLGVSQELRLIIAIFIFSLGGWVWFNFFSPPREGNSFEFELYRIGQDDDYFQPINLLGRSEANLIKGNIMDGYSTAQLDTTFGSENIRLVQADVPDSEEDTGEIHVLPSLVPSEGPQTSLEEDSSDSTVTPVLPPRIADEIEVLELPFLVTQPPAPPPEEDTLSASRTTRQRSSVNPFTPMVLATAPPAPPIRSVPPPQAPQAVVTSTSRPTATPAPSRTVANTTTSPVQLSPEVLPPIPRPVTPPSSQATISRLPQALPNGTLPVTPTLLSRPTRPVAVSESSPIAHAPPAVDITQVVAVRTPSTMSASTPVSTTSSVPASNSVSSVPPAVSTTPPNNTVNTALASTGEQVEMENLAPIGLSTALSRSFEQPQPIQTSVAPGITALSRYLRDTNLSFTGAVLGPVSLAVFNANQQSFSVQLGQNLPDTDIILTDIKNHEVELTQGNESQVLILDLRR